MSRLFCHFLSGLASKEGGKERQQEEVEKINKFENKLVSTIYLFKPKIRNFGRSVFAFTMPIPVSPRHLMRYLQPN